MKCRLLILIAACALLSACNEDKKEATQQQAPAESTADTQREALRQFSTKEKRKVETLEEYQARQKAEAGKK